MGVLQKRGFKMFAVYEKCASRCHQKRFFLYQIPRFSYANPRFHKVPNKTAYGNESIVPPVSASQ